LVYLLAGAAGTLRPVLDMGRTLSLISFVNFFSSAGLAGTTISPWAKAALALPAANLSRMTFF